MSALNRSAGEAMTRIGVHAATDVTGFGLLGHLRNMTRASGCSATVWLDCVPVIEAAWGYVRDGVAPGGTHANWRFLADFVRFDDGVGKDAQLVLCDAQTSGGLLIAVEEAKAPALVDELARAQTLAAAVVGRLEDGEGGITVKARRPGRTMPPR
jgi:selenide,water dikinase